MAGSAETGDGMRICDIQAGEVRIPLRKPFKTALRTAYPWQHIATSRDMELTWTEKFVSQSMDMMVGQRAQVLIGNGVGDITLCSVCEVAHLHFALMH